MKQSKITFITSIGIGLEQYDLILYSLLAAFISEHFFPAHNQAIALFATFGVYALGNIARPIGGVIFGILGDKFGRKNIVANTMFLMAIVTFLMGVTPTFATLGITATIIFSILKILQGVLFGADMPGTLTFLLEHIDKKHYGRNFGFMAAATGLGISFGTFIIWGLTKILTESQMHNWGFRIPFLLGGCLAVIGFYIRKNFPETPVFLELKKSEFNLKLSINKKNIWRTLNVIGISLFPVCFIVFFAFLPITLHNVYSYINADIYLAMTCAYIWSSILIPVFGWISDYIGKKLLLITATLVALIFCFPMFILLQTKSLIALFSFVFFGQTIIATMITAYFILIPQAFPAPIRCTGAAFSYNMTFVIASLTTLLTNYIYAVLKQPQYVVYMFMILIIISLISTLMLKTDLDT